MNKIFTIKSSWSKLVSTRRSMVLSGLQWGFPTWAYPNRAPHFWFPRIRVGGSWLDSQIFDQVENAFQGQKTNYISSRLSLVYFRRLWFVTFRQHRPGKVICGKAKGCPSGELYITPAAHYGFAQSPVTSLAGTSAPAAMTKKKGLIWDWYLLLGTIRYTNVEAIVAKNGNLEI